MADTDISITEILRKAVETDIEKRVYEKIKTDLLRLKFIGGFAGVIILLLFTFHERVFTTVVDWGGKQLEDRIKGSIEHETTRLDTIRDLSSKTRMCSSRNCASCVTRFLDLVMSLPSGRAK